MPDLPNPFAERALAALDELIAPAVAGGVLGPSASLRFVLAYLHDAATPGTSRRAFDRLWRLVTRAGDGEAIARQAEIAAARHAIARAVGTREGASAPARAAAATIRRQDDEGRAQRDWERRGKHCPIQRPMLDRWP